MQDFYCGHGYPNCLIYISINTSIFQSSLLLPRMGTTHLTPSTCRRIWDMLLVWRMVSFMCITMLKLPTNISPKTCPAPTTTPSSTTWTSSLLSLHKAQRESSTVSIASFKILYWNFSAMILALSSFNTTWILLGIYHFKMMTCAVLLDDPRVDWLLRNLTSFQGVWSRGSIQEL